MKTKWLETKDKCLDQLFNKLYIPMRDQLGCGAWLRIKTEVGHTINNQVNEVWDRVWHQVNEDKDGVNPFS